jgi:hypothetical protein
MRCAQFPNMGPFRLLDTPKVVHIWYTTKSMIWLAGFELSGFGLCPVWGF